MDKIRTSVCIATYNEAKFLKEQIESLLHQTILPDEIVVSDDSSSDDTPRILEEYQNRHPRLFRIFLHKDNLGFVGNFERCLKEARGDFVVLCDQDDIWLPEKLEKQIRIFQQYPEVGMVFCDLKVVNSNLALVRNSFWDILGFREEGD
ncbi:MAG: glycosyltransferase [Caldiserica bacterium]|jgi:glycosyltransferase involved in cell wall biosynthesis|nr:glycosyltransferase [Caldisericota bacterium]